MTVDDARGVVVRYFLGLGFTDAGLTEALADALPPDEAERVRIALVEMTEPSRDRDLDEALDLLNGAPL